MAIRVKSNVGAVSQRILQKLQILKDREYLLRPVCFDVIDMMTQRIHSRGENASGQAIGTYNNEYLRLRQRKYSRTGDKKIIVSLTRQLENDWSVIPTEKGYGVGFLNKFNLQKARWVEEIKGSQESPMKIFSLAKDEQEHAVSRVQELVKQALNDQPGNR